MIICRWYEGSHPWSINNNQGIEGLNKQIKKSHTFKRRCPLANFMDIVSRMINEWSREPSILNKPRVETLFNPKDGLKLRTDGYQWLKSNKAGSADRIICVKPDNKYTVSKEFGLGDVDNIWVVASSSNKMEGSLKERAKERIKQRGTPNFKSFDHYKKVRTSCWIVEERFGNFYFTKRVFILENVSVKLAIVFTYFFFFLFSSSFFFLCLLLFIHFGESAVTEIFSPPI